MIFDLDEAYINYVFGRILRPYVLQGLTISSLCFYYKDHVVLPLVLNH